MHHALHRIVGDAAKLRDGLSIHRPQEYVGYKLVGLLACSVHGALDQPGVALAYAERLMALLEELMVQGYDMQLHHMVLDTDRIITELQDAAASEAVRRAVGLSLIHI